MTRSLDLQELQLQRFRDACARAARVPFFQDALKSAGLSSDRITHLDQLSRLPFTTKSQLRDHYPLGLLAVPAHEVRRLHASSGTRGKPTIAAYTADDLETWARLCARSLETVGVKEGDVLHNSFGYGLFTGGLGLHQGAEYLGATVIPASSGRSQHQLMLMSDFGARVLCCTPSYALTLAAHLDEKPELKSKLKLEIGVFGAEPWSEECRALIEKRLNIKAYDIYGLSEVLGPGVAIECREQNGLHVWEDNFIVEIIDPESGLPVADGESGELVLTTINKQAMPLLRYRTGDRCSLISEPCPCGLPYRRISRLQGRFDDMLIIRGVNVYPCEIESIIYSTANIGSEYQIVVDRERELDSLTLRVELLDENTAPDQAAAVELQLGDNLKQRLGLTARVEIVPADFLPRSEGKATRLLDLRTT